MKVVFEIMSILPEGKQNAISSEALMNRLQIRTKRDLQKRIAKERREGALILSNSTGGYYTSNDKADVAAFIRTLDNRARHTFAALKSARRFMKETEENQTSLNA